MTDEKRARKLTSPRTLALFVLAAVFLLLGAGYAATQQGALSARPLPAGPGSAGEHPFVIAATTLYVNESEKVHTGSTYAREYVTLNNSSTLTKLPFSLTSINGCRWVSIVNVTEANVTVSPFTSLIYNNVTTLNASGTVLAGPATQAFKACAGSQYWVNYNLWTFGIYNFVFTGLPVNATVTVTFGNYSGSTAHRQTLTAQAGTYAALSFKAAQNLTKFTVQFTTVVNGTQSCTDFAQVCTTPQFSFATATIAGGATVNKTGSIVFGKGYTPIVSATYSNWTVLYTEGNVTSSTSTGAFFLSIGSFWTNDVMAFAAEWVFGIIVVVILLFAFTWSTGSRRRREP